jgi:hypothetical protein
MFWDDCKEAVQRRSSRSGKGEALEMSITVVVVGVGVGLTRKSFRSAPTSGVGAVDQFGIQPFLTLTTEIRHITGTSK